MKVSIPTAGGSSSEIEVENVMALHRHGIASRLDIVEPGTETRFFAVYSPLSVAQVAALLWPSTLNLSLMERNRALIEETNGYRDASMKHLRDGAEVMAERNAARNERDGYKAAVLKLESDLVAARAETLKEASNCNRWAIDYYAVRDERDAARASSEGHASRLVNLTAEKNTAQEAASLSRREAVRLEADRNHYRSLYESLKGAAESRGCTVIVAEGMSCTISQPSVDYFADVQAQQGQADDGMPPSQWRHWPRSPLYHRTGRHDGTYCGLNLRDAAWKVCRSFLPPPEFTCRECASKQRAFLEAEPILNLPAMTELHFLQGLDPSAVAAKDMDVKAEAAETEAESHIREHSLPSEREVFEPAIRNQRGMTWERHRVVDLSRGYTVCGMSNLGWAGSPAPTDAIVKCSVCFP